MNEKYIKHACFFSLRKYLYSFPSRLFCLFVDRYLTQHEPAGKGLTSWLSFVMSNCEVVTFPLVTWIRCGANLCRFLIFVLFLSLNIVILPVGNTVLLIEVNFCIMKSDVPCKPISDLKECNLIYY